jgi:hypothetical protein
MSVADTGKGPRKDLWWLIRPEAPGYPPTMVRRTEAVGTHDEVTPAPTPSDRVDARFSPPVSVQASTAGETR